MRRSARSSSTSPPTGSRSTAAPRPRSWSPSTYHTLLTGLGLAETSTGDPITAAEARRLACTAGILPVVLGGAGEILDLGRTRRLFSPAQRKAMAIRDRDCRAEGCDIPAAWCEAHHANEPWAKGGRTDLADGNLLCSFHHHRAHDPRYDPPPPQRRRPLHPADVSVTAATTTRPLA